MKMRLLIATSDNDYAEHLSGVLSEKYAETFDVNVCSSPERLQGLLGTGRYDIALLESEFIPFTNSGLIRLPLVFIDETNSSTDTNGIRQIRKYQRISSIVGYMLESYSEISNGFNSFNTNKARITVVWSPSGGSGKTTVALAYAASLVSNGKQVIYLNLESFSSTQAYFQENGKSISKVFEKLESNVQVFLMGIRQEDVGSGISYFCGPENYDDMNILTKEETEMLVNACAVDKDELVIDLSSHCDDKVQKILELADRILLVTEPSNTSQIKLRQFMSQHNIFSQMQSKTILVNNKGSKFKDVAFNKAVQLPLVQSTDQISIYKALSSNRFDW